MLKLVGNHYFLRTPLYPLQFTDNCFKEDISLIMNRPEFRYGLYIASKDLLDEYTRQLESGKVTPKMINSIQKYWLRASTRCTPYANFAGCSLGTFGDKTDIYLKQPTEFEPVCRLDMDLIHKVLDQIYKDEQIRVQIIYFVNNSLYSFGDQYRYVRYNFHGKRSYLLSEAEITPYLKEIINFCRKGATIKDLVHLLMQYDIDETEAQAYINNVIGMQLLTSELEPTLTGEEPFDTLCKQLSKYEHTENYTQLLTQIHNTLQNNNYEPAELEHIIKQIDAAGIKTAVKTLFQCDLKVTTESNTISKNVIDTILQQINELVYASYKKPGIPESLDRFIKQFSAKYENQTIPLSHALDVENGIGYGQFSKNINAFIGDLNFTSDTPEKGFPIAEIAQTKFNDSLQLNYDPIDITSKEINIKEGKKITFPFTFGLQQSVYMMGSLFGTSEGSPEEGSFKFLIKSLGGTSYANLLARFSHLDKDIENWICSLTRNEEQSLPQDIVFAEIVHLPQERLGNIISRPLLRAYEIPYLGNSGIAREYQLSITDLMVKVSGGEIILMSKKLKKRVIPRFTTALNYSMNSLPLYKFLCDLQNQQCFGGISWANMVSSNPTFSPRITYKNIILKRATWKITKDDIANLPKKDNEIQEFITKLRTRRHMPELLVFQQSDNELLINFNYADSIKILIGYIEKHSAVTLCEFFGDEKQSFIKSAQGSYTNELLIPLKIEATVNNGSLKIAENEIAQIKRVFVPGEEWAFYKIYCSQNAGEELLHGTIKKLVGSLKKKGLIDKFFFIRYSDPDFHLRVRFKLKKEENFLSVSQMMKKCINKQIKDKLVSKLQIDTYEREIERYGGKAIDDSESIFYYDSLANLSILHLINEHSEDRLRWNIALIAIDALMNDAGYDLKKKLEMATMLQKRFFTEFGGSLALQRSLNDKYRNLKDPIFAIFKSDNQELDKYKSVIQERSIQNIPVFKKIKEAGNSVNIIDELMPSYLHMFMNRLFHSENRKYELTSYHLLHKYYTSIHAIKEKAQAV